jgi:oxygen-dependent protoporphyrinogen oxidase
MKQIETEVLVIGAGLTGLTTAFKLRKLGIKATLIECKGEVGGQIKSYRAQGFIAESGPNTGVVSYPEVAELFAALAPDCILETAREEAKKRLIWKGDHFRPIPSSLIGAIATPLFTWNDKLRILTEPFRAKSTDPNESVASMTRRRLGKSFLNYAVDPFLAGVYAGDPETLITRYALPKLYRLEQAHGSFILGGIAKQREKRTERDKLATKKVFSAQGGLDKLTTALANHIGSEQIILNANQLRVMPQGDQWIATYIDAAGQEHTIQSHTVVSTVGGYNVAALFPFIPQKDVAPITALEYASVVQVSVGFDTVGSAKFEAFGGLVPSIEKRSVLGILYPSSCFEGRCPKGGALFSFFLGGKRNPELTQATDDEIKQLIDTQVQQMLHLPATLKPTFMRIFRHSNAIPQYTIESGERLKAINKIESDYSNLYLAGNIRDGIGMADRIKQGITLADSIEYKTKHR